MTVAHWLFIIGRLSVFKDWINFSSIRISNGLSKDSDLGLLCLREKLEVDRYWIFGYDFLRIMDTISVFRTLD